ncbi:hypothetical protein Tco_1514713 [Tanacetum coccineum]
MKYDKRKVTQMKIQDLIEKMIEKSGQHLKKEKQIMHINKGKEKMVMERGECSFEDIALVPLSIRSSCRLAQLFYDLAERMMLMGSMTKIKDHLTQLTQCAYHLQARRARYEDLQQRYTGCKSSDLVFYESPRFVTHIDDPTIAAFTKYYKEVFVQYLLSSDLVFYESPRFVTHIDDPTIAAFTKYYKEVFPPSNTLGVALLDMCSKVVIIESDISYDYFLAQTTSDEGSDHNPFQATSDESSYHNPFQVTSDESSDDTLKSSSEDTCSSDYAKKPTIPSEVMIYVQMIRGLFIKVDEGQALEIQQSQNLKNPNQAVTTWQRILNKEFGIISLKEDVGGSLNVRSKGKRKML